MSKLKILDHSELFCQPEYQKQFEGKKEFECGPTTEEVRKVSDWTKTEEYKEKNFARSHIKINPAKACQPLGALYCALGFEDTLPFCQGAQGCVAYFRSHLNRHFKEPVQAVSSSMTEDAAVFGGLNNMTEGLENAYALYKPKMMAIFTSCIAEVIGDDLNAYTKGAKEKALVPQDLLTPYANTPSFVGSHIVGYDNMLKSILKTLTAGKKKEPNGKVNIVPGFDPYIGNYREIKRIMDMMGIKHTVLADVSDSFDAPNTGQATMYRGLTTIDDTMDSVNAMATIALQKFSTAKTMDFINKEWNQKTLVKIPVGVRNTDELIDELCKITGKTVPQELEDERGRVVDAMIDSHTYVHGKRFAFVGDPDLLLGMVSIVMEMGGEPVHIVCTNGDKSFQEDMETLLATSPYGADGKVYINKDMWHLRSLMFTDPVDVLIGNSYAKFLWRDTGTPLVRFGFPLFDRHHLHRYPIIGYQGALNVVTTIVNALLDELDRATINTTSFDVIR
ncbi:MAG: nitrogenase molybdenum-iron protein subunit beta [Dissulfurispiraceae bacterium]|jgi:nitrogenase molybdenum-iron protein beta chain